MFTSQTAVLSCLLAVATAQQIGLQVLEVHPKIKTQYCTKKDGCMVKNSALVADSYNRPINSIADPKVTCKGGDGDRSVLKPELCPDAATCAKNCAIEGADYSSMGVSTQGTAMTLRQWLYNGTNYQKVSPRLYLLAEDDKNYEPMKLMNQEFAFDVDMAQLGCGMNAALYLSEMDMSGARTENNPAGAQYGTGYCDAQCFPTSFVNGVPNTNNSGICCAEMDIWEANGRSTAYTPHTCAKPGPFLCAGDECKNGTFGGLCDKNGCGLNPYKFGAKDFYGPNGTGVNTLKPFTVITQFITSDNTPNGDLVDIRRMYVQDGKVIQNAPFTPPGKTAAAASVNTDFCTALDAKGDFLRLGGMKSFGQSLQRGHVLIFSLWSSDGDFMNWLDSGEAGNCDAKEGDPKLILASNPNIQMTFSNIKWGDIGTTFPAGVTPPGMTGMTIGGMTGGLTQAAPKTGGAEGVRGLMTGAEVAGVAALGAALWMV